MFYLVGALNPLSADIYPEMIKVRPGDHFRLECSASGSDRVTFSWTKVKGQMSSNMIQNDEVLEVVAASYGDGGHYRCEVVDDEGRSAEAFTEVILLGEKCLEEGVAA